MWPPLAAREAEKSNPFVKGRMCPFQREGLLLRRKEKTDAALGS